MQRFPVILSGARQRAVKGSWHGSKSEQPASVLLRCQDPSTPLRFAQDDISVTFIIIPQETEINALVKQIFDEIRFTQEPAGLYDPLRYMIEIGGKRIRPRLCLTTYSFYSDTFDESIFSPAAALEVFHSFTLMHDDIMDRSPLRRGMPTVWKKWNEDTAILSGDVMLIDAYRRIAKAPGAVLDRALALFSRTAAQVCAGQQYDMEFESRPEIPMADYNMMIGLKTAVLLACSAAMGAIIGGASEQESDALYNYGYELGMAFQVADDYLDAFGDEKVFGKPIGGDIVNGKKSWLTVRTLEKTADKAARRTRRSSRRPRLPPSRIFICSTAWTATRRTRSSVSPTGPWTPSRSSASGRSNWRCCAVSRSGWSAAPSSLWKGSRQSSRMPAAIMS